MKKLLSFLFSLILLFCTIGLVGCGANDNSTVGVIYKLSSDESYAEVVGYEGETTDVIIAQNFKNKPVKTIREGAFKDLEITSITIPNSVINVGKGAFENCYYIKSMAIPFIGGSKEDATKDYLGYIFGADTHYHNGDYVPSALKTIILGDSETEISDYAFNNCAYIKNIEIPNSVLSIGSYAFSGCSALQSIEIPKSVTKIGVYAFINCYALTQVHIDPMSIWRKTTNETDWNNKTGGAFVDVDNPLNNAGALRNSFYYWYKV